MSVFSELQKITPSDLLVMDSATRCRLLAELEYRAYLVRHSLNVTVDSYGPFARRAMELITACRDAGAHDAGSLQAVLCDGQALAGLGIGDADTELVEYAHALAGDAGARVVVYAGPVPMRPRLFERVELALDWCERANADTAQGAWVLLHLDGYLAGRM